MYGAGRCCVRSRWGTAQEDEPAAHACRQPLVLAAVESEQGCISLAAPFCSTKAVQQAAQAAAILQTSRTRGRAHSLTNRACLRQIMPERLSFTTHRNEEHTMQEISKHPTLFFFSCAPAPSLRVFVF